LLLLTLVLIIGAIKLQKLTKLPRLELGLPIRLGLTGLILAIGGAVIVWAFRSLSIQQRGRELVTTGPYRYVRHPRYTAVFVAGGLAAFFVTQTFLVLIAIVLMILVGYVVVGSEEKLMEQRFGQAWRDYARRTPRFFPRLVRK
jgi:protein-S-isoprenylcysteine O-methyltransferase Ste14